MSWSAFSGGGLKWLKVGPRIMSPQMMSTPMSTPSKSIDKIIQEVGNGDIERHYCQTRLRIKVYYVEISHKFSINEKPKFMGLEHKMR